MTNLETAIRAELKRDHVSFAELSRIEGFRGSCEIGFLDRNILIWQSISREAIDIIRRIQVAHEVYLIPASSALIYIIDGVTLNLPIAKRWQHYKTLHWLPTVFTLEWWPDRGTALPALALPTTAAA